MHRTKIAEIIDNLLTVNDIDHLEYDDNARIDQFGINCKGDHDDLGRTLHMLYTNNLNDVTRVEVVDEVNVGDNAGLFWFIHIRDRM